MNIALDLTPSQRTALLTSLQRYESALNQEVQSATERRIESTHIEVLDLIKQVAATPCGDPYCPYCGTKTLEWESE